MFLDDLASMNLNGQVVWGTFVILTTVIREHVKTHVIIPDNEPKVLRFMYEFRYILLTLYVWKPSHSVPLEEISFWLQ